MVSFVEYVQSLASSQQRQRSDRWTFRARAWVWLAVMLSVGASSSFGQETRATLGGKVFDPQKAAVPGATVTVTAEDTGVHRTTTTNETGNWRVQFLVPGRYHFEVQSSGFKTARQNDIQLQIADQKYIDTTLDVGATSDSILVEATTPLIDTTAAVSGTVIAMQHLQELPSQTNSPTLLVGLTPGAYTGLGTGSSVAHLWGNAGMSNITVNGGAALPSSQSGFATNYQMDGAPDGNAAGQVAFVPPLDAVAEFRVVTNAYDASIGRSTGATINMSLKSGSEAFHGTLYEFNQNNFLNANYFQNNASKTAVPLVHTNEYGGQVGGPVILPKLNGRKRGTYFFFNYDGIRNKTPGSTGYMSIPTMKERQGDFTESYTTSTVNGVTTKYPLQIFNPFTADASGTRAQIAGAVLPSNLINASILKLLAMLPAPDGPGDGASTDSNNYVKKTVQDDKFGSYSARVDQNWNNAHHSYVSLRWNKMAELSYDPFGAGNLLQGLWQHRINRGLTLDHTWLISPTKVLDLRYSITNWDASSNNTGAGVDPTAYGISKSFASLQTLASIPLLTGLVSGAETGGLGTNQYSYTNDRFQDFNAVLTQTHRNHTLRYGAQYMFQQRGAGDLGQAGGSFAFDTKWTVQNPLASSSPSYYGSAIASALLGLPTSGSIPKNLASFWSQRYAALYFQDDWRVTEKLTVNLGLRWDVQRPVSERYDGFWTNFDPNVNLSPITAVAQPAYASLISGASTNRGVQLLQQYRGDANSFVARGGVMYANQNGQSRYQENTRYRYFQPRVGMAYRLGKNTVVRGGLGRFVQSSFNTGSNLGYSSTTTFQATTDSYITPSSTFNNPFPNGLTAATGNSLGILTRPGEVSSFTYRNIGRVYVDEASVHAQQQVKDFLFEVGGMLGKSHNLAVGYNINLPSQTAWRAAYGPTFDATTGSPNATKPGDVVVSNPFKGAPYIVSGTQNNSTVSAYQLLRPNPLRGDITETLPNGKSTYYALQTKVERRFKNGFNFLQSFSWAKTMSATGFLSGVPQTVSQSLVRQLDSNDRRFLYVTNATYELPFGNGKHFGNRIGKGLNRLVGGWEFSGVYTFSSGTPLTLATNTSFFKGTDPSLGSKKTMQQWFDTSAFQVFPSKSITVAQLQAYPSWTGVQSLPGYNYTPTAADTSSGVYNGVYQDFTTYITHNSTVFGNIRNPYTTDLTLGIRKNIQINERVKLQLRMDAFNALNHPRFGSIDTTPGDKYFGYVNGSTNLSQVNAPRAIQLSGKLYF